MPIYRVTVAGKQYTVNVPNPAERPVRAIVDGEVVEVHVDAPTGVRQPQAPGPQSVSQVPTPPSTPSSTPPPSPTSNGTTAADGIAEVKAPLPGVIVSIGVAEGENVERGQQLCVLEAMKMNNPIRATEPGTVREILVSPGQQVEHDAVLMVIGASAKATG